MDLAVGGRNSMPHYLMGLIAIANSNTQLIVNMGVQIPIPNLTRPGKVLCHSAINSNEEISDKKPGKREAREGEGAVEDAPPQRKKVGRKEKALEPVKYAAKAEPWHGQGFGGKKGGVASQTREIKRNPVREFLLIASFFLKLDFVRPFFLPVFVRDFFFSLKGLEPVVGVISAGFFFFCHNTE